MIKILKYFVRCLIVNYIFKISKEINKLERDSKLVVQNIRGQQAV